MMLLDQFQRIEASRNEMSNVQVDAYVLRGALHPPLEAFRPGEFVWICAGVIVHSHIDFRPGSVTVDARSHTNGRGRRDAPHA
jgi:hypothetical protein